MGLFYSRPNEMVENVDLSSTTYRYPPKSGNYFSSHFIMGDQTFAGTQPECFLFGDNSDLNFLNSRPVAFPYPETHKSEPTKMLRSLVNLRKDSLRLVKNTDVNNDESATDTYYIDFVFDADVKCSVTVHYLALEDLSSGHAVYTTKDSSLTSRVFEFEKGANQSFGKHGKFHLIKPTSFREYELIYSETTNHIPVVIHITATEEEYAGHSNITMANIEKLLDETYTIKLVKQKQMVDGLCYLLHEIYGLESKEEGEAGEDKTTDMSDDDYDEYTDENVVCVVCMSDTRDTLMLPCKHLCVCSDCASSLRSGANNCPICRVPFYALLQLCAYQRKSSTTNPKSQDPYPGYEKVDLYDALNAFNTLKRHESAREIVRRVSSRRRSRSRPTTPKPSQVSSGNDKMMRRSSSRFSRASHGSQRRDHVDTSSEPAASVSKASLRSSSKGSGKSHVIELQESNCVVNMKNQASDDRVPSVEGGIEVGQDNLGVDSLEEETAAKRQEHPGSTKFQEVDETSPDPVPVTPTPYSVPLPGTPLNSNVTDSGSNAPTPYNVSLPPTPMHRNLIDPVPEQPSPYNVPLPGTLLDRDLIDNAGADSEPRYDSSADIIRDGPSNVETLIV